MQWVRSGWPLFMFVSRAINVRPNIKISGWLWVGMVGRYTCNQPKHNPFFNWVRKAKPDPNFWVGLVGWVKIAPSFHAKGSHEALITDSCEKPLDNKIITSHLTAKQMFKLYSASLALSLCWGSETLQWSLVVENLSSTK